MPPIHLLVEWRGRVMQSLKPSGSQVPSAEKYASELYKNKHIDYKLQCILLRSCQHSWTNNTFIFFYLLQPPGGCKGMCLLDWNQFINQSLQIPMSLPVKVKMMDDEIYWTFAWRWCCRGCSTSSWPLWGRSSCTRRWWTPRLPAKRYKSEKVKVKILFFILIKDTWHMFNVSVSINQRGSGSSEERAKLMTSKYLTVIYLIRDGSAYQNRLIYLEKY